MTNNEAPSQEWADAKAADDAKGIARITDHRTRPGNRRTSATFPANAAELEVELDRCTSCGFDLGTHHPTCTSAYPNRRYDPQEHASDTEMAIAHLYAAAKELSHRDGIAVSADELPAHWQRNDTMMDAVANLCKTTGSSISLVFDVAKTLR